MSGAEPEASNNLFLEFLGDYFAECFDHLRMVCRTLLSLENYHQVIEAEDGIAALERYFIDKPDLILLDLNMSGVYGLDVLSMMLEMDADARES